MKPTINYYKKEILTRVIVFRQGSVISNFSIIFNEADYKMISPLVKAVNQTVSQGAENNFGDLTIQLLSVEPINGKA